MKKIYMKPNTVMVELTANYTILTGSTEEVGLKGGSASEWGSRRGNSDWDEDDEDF